MTYCNHVIILDHLLVLLLKSQSIFLHAGQPVFLKCCSTTKTNLVERVFHCILEWQAILWVKIVLWIIKKFLSSTNWTCETGLEQSVFQPPWFKWSVLMLCAPVFIFTSGGSELLYCRASMLWFMDLTVATCHIQYPILSLSQIFSWENGQNTEILEVSHFCMTWKWPATVARRIKHKQWESFHSLTYRESISSI